MSALKTILAGAAGLAAIAGLAGPASAQYYPGYNAPGYGYGYGYNNNYGTNVGNAVGQAINGVIGALRYGTYPYGNYGYGNNYGYGYGPTSDAVDRCARAVESRLNGYGYNNRYAQGGGRVTGITRVDPRGNGGLRVWGVASTYSGYGYGQPTIGWDCKIDRYGRVTDTNLDTNRYGYRGW